jgi:acetyl-CoA acetyltransferase
MSPEQLGIIGSNVLQSVPMLSSFEGSTTYQNLFGDNTFTKTETNRLLAIEGQMQRARARDFIRANENQLEGLTQAIGFEALSRASGFLAVGGTQAALNRGGVSSSGVGKGVTELLAGLTGMAVAGVEPRIMGIGPAPAVKKVLAQVGLSIDQIDVIELNEAFAAQGLAVLREIGVADDDSRVNPNGGAIALGHPLGASGARIITTALNQLERTQAKYALCTMCIGVGQGIAVVIERV